MIFARGEPTVTAVVHGQWPHNRKGRGRYGRGLFSLCSCVWLSGASELARCHPHQATHVSCLRMCSDRAGAVLEHSLDMFGTWAIRSVAHFLVLMLMGSESLSAASASPAQRLLPVLFAVNSETPRESWPRTTTHCKELAPTVLQDRMASSWWICCLPGLSYRGTSGPCCF